MYTKNKNKLCFLKRCYTDEYQTRIEREKSKKGMK